MSNGRPIEATIAAAVVLGAATLAAEHPGWPTAGINDAIALPLGILAAIVLFLVPLIVGRWWVVGAIAGPLLALLILQLTGAAVSLDDGTGPAFNYRTIFFLIVVASVLLLLGSLRRVFEDSRRERAEDRGQLDQPGERGTTCHCQGAASAAGKS